MPILLIFQQYQEFFLILLKKNFENSLYILIGIFYPWANQYCWAGWVGGFFVAHSQYTNTASWATTLHPLVMGGAEGLGP